MVLAHLRRLHVLCAAKFDSRRWKKAIRILANLDPLQTCRPAFTNLGIITINSIRNHDLHHYNTRKLRNHLPDCLRDLTGNKLHQELKKIHRKTANHNGKLQATYLAGHDKVLLVDERGVGVRTDYNGVLLLDTILQVPVAKPDDIVRLELLVSEVRDWYYAFLTNNL
ncbi:Baculoviral IAP repeat-containing protein 6 [Homalodisca vitripennis]|nr:Baculoviral IAP repeat-containing protein 6 [Homalodisca vitripennis]